MDKTKSRDVSQQEIPATYKGILRISPNGSEDSPTVCFNNLNKGSKLEVSDSAGNFLGLAFEKENITNITIDNEPVVNIVVTSDTLNTKSKLNISSILNVENTTFAIGPLIYPSESPHDINDYFYKNIENYKNLVDDDDIDEKINAWAAENKDKSSNSDNKVVVNGREIERVYNNKLINEYKHNDKVLLFDGSTDTDNNTNTVDNTTIELPKDIKLSFENIENDIWNLLKNSSDTVRHSNGRYDGIGDDDKKSLLTALNLTIENAKANAPKLGLSVPYNVIMYNAMPARRFLFHKERLKTNSECLNNNTNFLRDLIKEFSLCDGTHNTPPLFGYVQGSPTYLRGLNWLDNETNNPSTYDNPHPYKLFVDKEDVGDNKLIKNFTDNAKYPANYDYKIRNYYKHQHYLFYNENSLVPGDSLYTEKNWLPWKQKSGGYYLKMATTDKWENYIKFTPTDTEDTSYVGTYIMRNIVDALKLTDEEQSKIKNAPISFKGGTTSSLALVAGGHKNARKRRFGKCQGNYINDERRYYQDGGYKLAAYVKNGPDDQGWRGLTSTERQNKYGNHNSLVDEPKTVHYGGTKIKVDDTLPCPPTLNLLPLIRKPETTSNNE